jgi:hypothetical protein
MSSLATNVSKKERARMMILGGFLADAATMGLHWVYDQKEIADLVSTRNQSGVFFNPPINKYYNYENGRLSPYGDENLPLVDYLATSKNSFDTEAFSTTAYNFFSGYGGRLNHAIKQFVENRSAGKPFAECVAVDHQANGIIKMPLIVARYGSRSGAGDGSGSAILMDAAEKSVRSLQDSDMSVAAAQLLALVLERVLDTGCTPEEAVRWAGESDVAPAEVKPALAFVLNDALLLQWTHLRATLLNREGGAALAGRLFPVVLASPAASVEAAVGALLQVQSDGESSGGLFSDEEKGFLSAALETAAGLDLPDEGYSLQTRVAAMGLSCALPASLLGVLHIALNAESYEEAMTENILCGGDNCSRSIVLGGLFGASASSLPEEWKAGVESALWARLESSAEQVVQAR